MSSQEQSKTILFLLLFFPLAFFPRAACAAIEFLSAPTTLQSGYGSVLDDTRFQFDSEEKPVSFHFSGESFQPYEMTGHDSSNDVLDYAYMDLRARSLGTKLSLGRVSIDEGATQEVMDGIYAQTHITGSAGLRFFSGRGVTAADDLIGGRFTYRFSNNDAAGVSYVSESDGETTRQETGVHIELRPFPSMRVSGRSLADAKTENWIEHSYSARFGPFHDMTFTIDGALTDNSDSDTPDLLPAVGVGIEYLILPSSTVGLDLKKTEDDAGGNLFSEGIRYSYSPSETSTAGVSIGYSRNDDNANATDISLFGVKRAGRFKATVNLQQTIDHGLNENGITTTSTFGLAYSISPEYRLAADIQRANTGEADVDFRTFIKLEYRFGS